jgi:hypothetical protein
MIGLVGSHASIINLEHVWTLGATFHLELTRTCWSIINHELTRGSWAILECKHIRSSWPIIYFKSITVHRSCIAHLLHSAFEFTPKIHKLRLLKVAFRINWPRTLSHQVIVGSSSTHIWSCLVHIVWVWKLFLDRLWVLVMTKTSSIVCFRSLLRDSHWLFLYTLMELASVDCIHLYGIQWNRCIWLLKILSHHLALLLGDSKLRCTS